MFGCFGVRFVTPFLKQSKISKWPKKAVKLDKHVRNFIIFSQASGPTWYHTSAYQLSSLVHVVGRDVPIPAVIYCISQRC